MADICARGEQAPLSRSLLITRYEDLAAGDPLSFQRLFEHLGASHETSLIDRIIEQTAFANLRAKSRQNAFFRRGAPGAWREEMTPQQVQAVLANAGTLMARFDYA